LYSVSENKPFPISEKLNEKARERMGSKKIISNFFYTFVEGRFLNTSW